MRKIIKRFLAWCFREELSHYNKVMTQYDLEKVLVQQAITQLQKERVLLHNELERVQNVLSNFDVSVDVHHYGASWAVVSLQGNKYNYLKFIDLGDKDFRDISCFLSQFDRRNHIKIDCSPMDASYFNHFKDRTFKI